jgi:hypothetical protein
MKQLMHLHTFALLLVAAISERAGESRAGAPQQQTNTVPNVLSMPVRFAGWPALTSEEVASLQARLSQGHFESLTNLETALLRGSKLMPVSFVFCSQLGRDEKAHPYDETISVIRLNEQKDLVVVEDNRSGVNVIRRWFIRDVPGGTRGPQK